MSATISAFLLVVIWIVTWIVYWRKLRLAVNAIEILNQAHQQAVEEIAALLEEKSRLEAKVRQVNEREDHLIAAIQHFYNNTIARYTGHIELLNLELQNIGDAKPAIFEKLKLMEKAARQLAIHIQSFSRPVTRQEKIDEYLKMGTEK